MRPEETSKRGWVRLCRPPLPCASLVADGYRSIDSIGAMGATPWGAVGDAVMVVAEEIPGLVAWRCAAPRPAPGPMRVSGR
jgi:hypothetical protein